VKQRPVVALVCDVIYPYSHGGRELRYRELLPRLAERAEIHVYTMQWWDGPSTFSDRGVTYHAISRLVPLYKDNRRSFRQAIHFGFACMRLLKYEFDVLEADHIPYFQVFVLRIVAALKRKPLTVTWHEVWSREYWCQYLGLAGWIAWLIEWLAMRLPGHIIAASPQTAERLANEVGKRIPITTIPNGIDLNLIREVSPSGEPSDLVVVGRLIGHKRVDMLLDLIAELHTYGMHLTCRIIGDGPARTSLEEQAQALGIAKTIEFRHDVADQKELYSLIKSAKLFVSLSTREGFGMAVLEAIACGVPVLTTSAPDNLAQHLVAKYSRGTVCDPTLSAAVAAVYQLLDDKNLHEDKEPGIDPWILDYDWSAIAERIANIYLV
jgi:glycosyltransferase involved in cell wall biosynthesis